MADWLTSDGHFPYLYCILIASLAGWMDAESYYRLGLALARMVLPRPHLVVQTSSLQLYSRFEALAGADGTRFGITDNERSDHDRWGGMSTGDETREGTVAAVNLWLAMRATHFLGLASSAWTHLVLDLIGDGTSRTGDERSRTGDGRSRKGDGVSRMDSLLGDGVGLAAGSHGREGIEGAVGAPLLFWCCGCRTADRYAQALLPPSTWVNGTSARHNNLMLLGTRVNLLVRAASTDAAERPSSVSPSKPLTSSRASPLGGADPPDKASAAALTELSEIKGCAMGPVRADLIPRHE